MSQVVSIQNEDTRQLVSQIGQLINEARRQVSVQVNSQLLVTYWHIGQLIVEHEQKSSLRAEYGKQTLREVSRQLTRDYGKGFSVSNLQFMRRFYEKYPIQQTLSVKLSWSHYCELLSISDDQRRSFYEKECERSGWSLRELKRQVDSSLFERLLLSSGDANKQEVMQLAEKGIDIQRPQDLIRDPYVFEFLGLPEDKPVMESDLEQALVRQLEKFLLELGRGFMFVGTQRRRLGLEIIADRLKAANDRVRQLLTERNDQRSAQIMGELKAAREATNRAYLTLVRLTNAYALLNPDRAEAQKLVALVSEDLEYFRRHAMSNPNANKKKKDSSDTDPQPDEA